jgi:hypothetical protein
VNPGSTVSYFLMAYVMIIGKLNNFKLLCAENNAHFCNSFICQVISMQCIRKVAVQLGCGTATVQACIDACGHHFQHLL